MFDGRHADQHNILLIASFMGLHHCMLSGSFTRLRYLYTFLRKLKALPESEIQAKGKVIKFPKGIVYI